jgi:monofunctional biosynthetic peptidoglycan transglycosylase
MKHLLRFLLLALLSALSLQLYFLGRVALMAVVDPQSTTFQRSEVSRLLRETRQVPWRQEWVDADRISHHLKRAVIASEDAGFTDHGGVEWDALEKAWERNQQAEARAQRLNQRQDKRRAAASANPPATPPRRIQARVVGGSTITQQLAKNLFLASEQNLLRKGQEIVVTFMLEALLSKERILEIYLNNVEWGEGVFGAQAAAQHYFRIPASGLGTSAAARLAVMLPAPKKFEKRPASAYMLSRAAVIQGRMGAVDLP